MRVGRDVGRLRRFKVARVLAAAFRAGCRNDGFRLCQFSLQDNLLLGHDDRVVHYRSPTEPGSSGSPVFDHHWNLIALHHSGSFALPRLSNAGGTYPANEGIAIGAICNRLRERTPSPTRIT